MAWQVSRRMIVIGIDPGKSGGIAWLRDGVAKAEKMPATERDIWDLIHWIYCDSVGTEWGPGVRAYIERVHSMPKQGVKSSFTFGQNYGFLRACLIAANIPLRISPNLLCSWETTMGPLPRGGPTSGRSTPVPMGSRLR